jgi:hypothetical protein
MKQLVARFGGATFLAAALAACSGGQSVTPPTNIQPGGPAVPAYARPQSIHVARPQVLRITAADRALAATMTFKAPHFYYPKFRNPYARLAPHAVGYPLDLACNPLGYAKQCTVMTSSTAYDIYVSLDGKTCMNESCWGTPEEFLKGLTGSSFLGLLQQYTGGSSSAYGFAGSMAVPYTTLKYSQYAPTFYANDLGTILAAAVGKIGKFGLNAEYHIFLPPGTDTCFDQSATCYSPDHLSAFAFCAYHTAAYVPSLKNYIIFSVEPWQDVRVKVNGKKVFACQDQTVPPGTNRLTSGTASTLSHESFESWTDPIPGAGWINTWSGGMEIGDICAYQFMFTGSFGGSSYFLQQEYDNSSHGCNN